MKPTSPLSSPKHRRHATAGTDPVLIELGDLVRAHRVAAGLTQDELSFVSGVGRELVIALELGRPGVAMGRASRVLKSLGLKLVAQPR